MILLLLHDRQSISNIALLRESIEGCYGRHGLRVQDKGYFFVPLQGRRINAARLLKYASGTFSREWVLWLVDRELYYPQIGSIMGCCTLRAAVLFSALEPEVLVKEALHEVGHLMGLEHCTGRCVMQLSRSPDEARLKPSDLCPACLGILKTKPGREGLKGQVR